MKLAIVQKVNCMFIAIPIKIPMSLTIEIEKSAQNFIWSTQTSNRLVNIEQKD
jgi:hypothetical protein